MHVTATRSSTAGRGPSFRTAPDFSLTRLVLAASTERGLDAMGSHEGAICAEAAERLGQQHDPHRILVPVGMLHTGRRDLTAGTASQGGYLVGSDLADPWEPLRPFSPVLHAGATVLPGLHGDTPVPRITADPTTSWLATESTSATESQHVIGQTVMRPKSVVTYVEASRQLMLQADKFEMLMRSTMLRAVGKALDAAVFNGSGASGQPLGILNTAGIGTASGTALSWSSVVNLRQSVCGAVGNDRTISWIGGTAAQSTLSKRERAAGSGFIWDANQIGGAPAYASSAIATDGLMLGDWSALAVGIWGDALRLEINPFASFQTGIVGIRVSLDCDLAVMNPAYFSAVSSIT